MIFSKSVATFLFAPLPAMAGNLDGITGRLRIHAGRIGALEPREMKKGRNYARVEAREKDEYARVVGESVAKVDESARSGLCWSWDSPIAFDRLSAGVFCGAFAAGAIMLNRHDAHGL